MNRALASTVLAAGLFASGLAHGAPGEVAPPYVRIHSFTHGGTGCPAGSVGANITSDRRILTVLFDQFVASAGPGLSIADTRKQCTLNVELEFPQGYSFSIATVDYRGFATLDSSVWGRQRSTYYFSGSPLSAALETVLHGGYNGDYFRRDTLGLDAVVWSPCGAVAPLNIKASVEVNNTARRTASGSMTVDTADLKVEQRYGLQWRQCH